MNDLRELYQETILDHYRQPRNFSRPAHANCMASGHNPLCGDQLKLYLQLEDGIIRNAGFEGSGCAISTASASLLTETIKGKSKAQALDLMSRFQDMVTGHAPSADMGKLAALAGVCEFPQRVKCATLAWHTMKAALEDEHEAVTTE
ncbi:Fe-S cluster assembly sulfur transfer protein SufU [Methylotenera sp. G11]|uniref:Fe-S cluster assembly sulfur transfer protein SufU n=1 Tax=Methylotenera sp. G11 TaxID=1506585 RepID=UPI000648E947|nr:SUF system NifU family Fe-S cluster assembly protein [Methylotenera sp. G11]